MKKIRKRLTPEIATSMGFEIKPNDSDGRNARYSLDREQCDKYFVSSGEPLRAEDFIITTTTANYEKDDVLSAVDGEGGIMNIDKYCEYYNLPRKDITSYKLVTHTGTPFYNVVFRENTIDVEEINYDFIEALVKKHISPIEVNHPHTPTDTFDRVIYADAHIGMNPNKSGNALYSNVWDEKELSKRRRDMVSFIVKNKSSDFLVVDELGDLVDGWDGHTVRKGHALPQNMTNQEMFDVAVDFKVDMIDRLHASYRTILLNNICEDNHAGAFGYVVNSAVKSILEQKYPNVQVINHMKFMNHYFIGKHCFVLCHGKDSHALKFGFKPHLDPKQMEKIDQYLKNVGVYKKSEFVEFSKGDSHQLLLDLCTSDDFDYCNYPALSPSSEWVQTNFKQGRSGFVMQIVDYNDKNKIILPYFF